ncbi:MAG: cyclopropane-fatty-acyl-phospholipid synthase family protein [Sphingomicrobium sp.]
MSVIGKLVGTMLKSGSITLTEYGEEPVTYGPGGGGKALKLRFSDRNVPFEIIKSPRLGLGEAYMDGRVVIETGTVLDLLQLILGANPWEEGKAARKVLSRGKSRFGRLFKRNTATKSKRNVAHHYDLGDELYDTFLDSDRQYSCAYFTSPDNELEEAQWDKKAHIAAKLHLKPGQKVLDIGSGWGGLAIYLHQVANVDVLGITLSEDQLRIARRRAEEAGVTDHVRFELIDYRLLDGEFDRIVSVGMFEHVGLEFYEEFFGKCRSLLKRDGVMLLHTIGKLGKAGKPDPFTDKWIFPGYHLPSLSQMSAASEKVRLITSDVETLRLHYAYTLRHWLRRVTDNRAQIEALYDARFFRMWEFYLSGGVVMFESGAGCNYQVQYVRDRHALPITRDYMAEVERKYRKA